MTQQCASLPYETMSGRYSCIDAAASSKKAMQWGRWVCHDENREEGGYFVEAKRWAMYLAHTDAVGL